MIVAHSLNGTADTPALARRLLGPDEAVPTDAVWIDLVSPTREEDALVEAFLGIAIPTREEMLDIEPSEVLYVEQGARYMTARLLCRADGEKPSITAVTFILKDKALVTVRYDEPRAFGIFAQRAQKPGGAATTPEGLMMSLVEAISDRAADVLQLAGERIDALSQRIFAGARHPAERNAEFRDILKELGRAGELLSKQRESLVSVERILLFLTASFRAQAVSKDLRDSARATLRDLQSLEEHATFLSNKVQFLLDATLGLVNLEQNNIIKIFSVVSVIFLPPTLIASIYGMNFDVMPELHLAYGYPMALVAMVLAAVLPYALFRWRGWL